MYKGRKKVLTDDQVIDIRDRVRAGEAKAALAREYGISRETLYQYLRTVGPVDSEAVSVPRTSGHES